MALIIEQRFPSGRFHATRWNQGSFGDAYGEWPPSPWRLLRALAARWFQYIREKGENKDSEAEKREIVLKPLLQSLADSLPAFYLPPLTWRGPALKQYQPTNLDWTDKSKAAAGYKKPQTTLVEDHYRAVPADESIFWHWESLDLEEAQNLLLNQLLERILYFGRAESFSRLRRIAALPKDVEINCRLFARGSGEMVPVLVPLPNHTLDLAALLAATDDKELKGRSIPPGTAWYYAQLPPRPEIIWPSVHCASYPTNLHCVQFALGGRVYPQKDNWEQLVTRFRNRVLKHKGEDGRPLFKSKGNVFLILPDENERPTRLVAWRAEPFTEKEIDAMLSASEKPLSWDYRLPDWKLNIIPLPFASPLPEELAKEIQARTNLITLAKERAVISVVHYALDSTVLPLAQDALPFAEQVRRALIRNRVDTAHSEAITGKTIGGTPLKGHEHAHYFATDEDGDGRLDHVTIYAPCGLSLEDVEALGAMKSIFRRGNRPDVSMVLAGLGNREQFSQVPVFTRSRRWRSVTPFSLPRFANRGGGRPPRPRDLPEAQLQRELRLHGLPEAVLIKRIEGYEINQRPMVRWLDFHTRRFKGDEGYGLAGFEIEFAETVEGPIALGFASHFSLGLFAPSDSH